MKTAKQQQGFTLTQTVIALAIISVVTTFGVLGIRTARAEFAHQSNARLFASYVEKARADAIRRHAQGGASSIQTFGPNTTAYNVTMDWGRGFVETRTFNLDNGLTFDTDAQTVSFDWRGRISAAWVFQIKSQYLQKNLPVDVSGSGDITVGEQHFPDQSIPAVQISQVNGDVASPDPTPSIVVTPPTDTVDPPIDVTPPTSTPTPTPTATPTPTPTNNGNGNGNGGTNGNGHGSASPTPTPSDSPGATPTPTPIPQCVAVISPSTLSLSQSETGHQTGTAVFTMTNATGVRTISAGQPGGGNALVVGLSLVRIDGSGSSTITVTTKHGGGNRGVFVVEVATDPSCGSTQKLTVSVSN